MWLIVSSQQQDWNHIAIIFFNETGSILFNETGRQKV